MSEFKGTPGPWAVAMGRAEAEEHNAFVEVPVIVQGEQEEWLASIMPTDEAAVDVANARLLAAAPDLLEALIGIRDVAAEYITDYAAEVQEGGNAEEHWHAGLMKWQRCIAAIAKALGEQS